MQINIYPFLIEY